MRCIESVWNHSCARLAAGSVLAAGVLLGAVGSGFAQASAAGSPGAREPDSVAGAGRAGVVEYLDTIALTDTAARRAVVANIASVEAARTRQTEVRARVLELIGGLPERTPLHAKTLGVTEADGFRIEKVLFESQPKFYVTGLLYVPEGRPAGTRFPAVLISPGHAASGKASDFQTSADFARNGFVVLSYDPLGQGERLQYPDPARPGASLASRPTGEHGEAGLQPTLIGDGVARYFVWDAMRAVDYLLTRPEVDPKRIGAFGCSGGGAVTAMTAALDPRIAAAGVACYDTSFDALLASIGPQDGEQSIPGFIAAGLDFPDWIELVAPRPYAAIATYADMFPFSGARATVAEARRFYSLFDPASAGNGPDPLPAGSPSGPALNLDAGRQVALSARLQFISGPGHHGALAPIMGNILGFFMRNLEPGSDAASPVLLPVSGPGAAARVPRSALQVTSTGQVSSSYPDAATVFTLNRERAARLVPAHRPVLRGPALARAVRRAIGASAVPGRAPDPGPETTAGGEFAMRSDGDITVRGRVSAPVGGGRRPAVLLLVPGDIDGQSAVARANRAEFDRLRAEGNVVLALTPSPSPPGTDDMKSPLLGPFYLLSLRAELVNRTLLGLRTDDVIHAVSYLAERRDVDPARITGVGNGHMGLVLMHAAVLDRRLRHVTVSHVLESYRSLLDAPVPTGAPEDIVPGVLLQYDIPDLVNALGERLTEEAPLRGSDDLSQDSTPIGELRH